MLIKSQTSSWTYLTLWCSQKCNNQYSSTHLSMLNLFWYGISSIFIFFFDFYIFRASFRSCLLWYLCISWSKFLFIYLRGSWMLVMAIISLWSSSFYSFCAALLMSSSWIFKTLLAFTKSLNWSSNPKEKDDEESAFSYFSFGVASFSRFKWIGSGNLSETRRF